MALRAPWQPPGLQIGPRSREWVHKTVLDSKMTSKSSQNGTFWMRNHSNTSRHLCVVWNRAGNPKVISEENWREFRPCRSHFFVAKRRQSTQQTRKVHRKIGESSVYVNGCLLLCTCCTIHSRCGSCVKNLASIPSMFMTALHSASATQYTVNSGRGRRHGVSH